MYYKVYLVDENTKQKEFAYYLKAKDDKTARLYCESDYGVLDFETMNKHLICKPVNKSYSESLLENSYRDFREKYKAFQM